MSYPETELNKQDNVLQPTADEVDAMRTILNEYYDQEAEQYLESSNPERYLALLKLRLFVEEWGKAQQSTQPAKRELWMEPAPSSSVVEG